MTFPISTLTILYFPTFSPSLVQAVVFSINLNPGKLNIQGIRGAYELQDVLPLGGEMPADAVVLASWIDETKTRKSSISLMGSIVAVLGEPNI